MIAASVPAALATVWTMLFSKMFEDLKSRNTAIEITAAGIEVAKVSPTFSPRYTLAAVKARVIRPPSSDRAERQLRQTALVRGFNTPSLHVAHPAFSRAG